MHIFKRVLPLLLCMPCIEAYAATTSFNGWSWLEHTPTLQAHFEQRTLNKYSSPIGPVAKGEFWIHRPGRFRWRYDQPNSQLTLSDGQHVTWYDPQLKQAVIKPASGSLTNALAQLLTANSNAIKNRFQSEQIVQDENYLLVVTPRNPDQEGFQKITLNWTTPHASPTLSNITVLDALGQRIEFKLSDVKTPSPATLSASLFSFTPPAGTTLLNETQDSTPKP